MGSSGKYENSGMLRSLQILPRKMPAMELAECEQGAGIPAGLGDAEQ